MWPVAPCFFISRALGAERDAEKAALFDELRQPRYARAVIDIRDHGEGGGEITTSRIVNFFDERRAVLREIVRDRNISEQVRTVHQN